MKGRKPLLWGVRGKMEQGHLRASVVLWGSLVFHGVEFAGVELCSLQTPDKYLVALHGTAANYILFFKPSIRRGTLTAASEGRCCPNTGFLCTKRLIKLQSEIFFFLFYIFFCLSVSGDERLWGLELRTPRQFKMHMESFQLGWIMFCTYFDENSKNHCLSFQCLWGFKCSVVHCYFGPPNEWGRLRPQRTMFIIKLILLQQLSCVHCPPTFREKVGNTLKQAEIWWDHCSSQTMSMGMKEPRV